MESKVSTWWIYDDTASVEVDEMLNDDINNQSQSGWRLVGMNTTPVGNASLVILRFERRG